MHLVTQPYREYLVGTLLTVTLAHHYLFDGTTAYVTAAALVGSIIPAISAWRSLRSRAITIEVFNCFALGVSFATGEYTSAAFIALMLTVASWLDWRTDTRASSAVEMLLKLKPEHAVRERGDALETVAASELRAGDIVVVKNGEQVPVDGVVVYGTAAVNEASLTGESVPVDKAPGSEVYAATRCDAGVLKVRATKVGEDSTLERMAALMRDASRNKSKAERLADRFAGIFFPIVLCAGVGTYLVTGSVHMMAALFLIVCADDIAVSIPLAVTAALGVAAKRGVIVKGGVWLQALARVRTIAFDKTGTLTSGSFSVVHVWHEPAVREEEVWRMLAVAEKLSEHPIGNALYRAAVERVGDVPDPREVTVKNSVGVLVEYDGHTVAVGSERLVESMDYPVQDAARAVYGEYEASGETALFVCRDGAVVGCIGVADTARAEAAPMLRELVGLGVRPLMLTGDHEVVAQAVATSLGITEVRARMTPETKVVAVRDLAGHGLAMVGDGVNDAPALAAADVGIAMGACGTAVAVEAANVVILTDRLDRMPDLVRLARKTVSVVNLNMAIWFVTNAVGVALVFMGIATPAFAALYNLLTDFLPIMNAARLFRAAR